MMSGRVPYPGDSRRPGRGLERAKNINCSRVNPPMFPALQPLANAAAGNNIILCQSSCCDLFHYVSIHTWIFPKDSHNTTTCLCSFVQPCVKLVCRSLPSNLYWPATPPAG
eukprot:3256584-Amphidinium_carterae.1